jgi:hypothetical protein
MGDYRLAMQFDIDNDRREVRRWLDDPAGIAGWWSDSVEGAASEIGDRFVVRFPTSPVPFELEVVEASEGRIAWHIAENPPWWQGTTIRFDLSVGEDGGTQLLFSHRDFDPDNPVLPVITPAWVRFLDSLKSVAESGVPNPAVVN